MLMYAYDQPMTRTRISSFWLPELRRLEVNVLVILVGCKLDLRDKHDSMSMEQVMTPIMQRFLMHSIMLKRQFFIQHCLCLIKKHSLCNPVVLVLNLLLLQKDPQKKSSMNGYQRLIVSIEFAEFFPFAFVAVDFETHVNLDIEVFIGQEIIWLTKKCGNEVSC
ncbi:hypothetical protein ABKV19_018518 [Rosa sericea]